VWAVLVFLYGSGDSDGVVEFDLRVSPNSRLFESGAGDDSGGVTAAEDGRTRRLFDLCHRSLDGHALADLEVGDGRYCRSVVDRDRPVVVETRLQEGHITVVADLVQTDEESVADAVFAREVRFVDESGDLVGDVDENAVRNDTVDDGVVVVADGDVLGRTVGSEIVDDRTRVVGISAGIPGELCCHTIMSAAPEVKPCRIRPRRTTSSIRNA
jgi:hypothetical protein